MATATAKTLPKVVNGVNVDKLYATVDAIKARPAIASFKFRVQNQWAGGSQNRSTVAGYYGALQEHSHPKPFVLAADEPAVLLGADMAANPVEHLLHALAACMTTSIVYHAAARGIQIDEVESSLEGDIDLRGFLDLDRNIRSGYEGIRVNFKIKADVPEAELQSIGQLGSRFSPVFDSLTRGVPVSVTTERL